MAIGVFVADKSAFEQQRHSAIVIHDDHDFDIIAEFTDLAARWIIPRGSGHTGQS